MLKKVRKAILLGGPHDQRVFIVTKNEHPPDYSIPMSGVIGATFVDPQHDKSVGYHKYVYSHTSDEILYYKFTETVPYGSLSR